MTRIKCFDRSDDDGEDYTICDLCSVEIEPDEAEEIDFGDSEGCTVCSDCYSEAYDEHYCGDDDEE